MAGVLTNVVKGSMLGRADVRLRQREDDGESEQDYLARLRQLRTWFIDALPHHEHAQRVSTDGKDAPVIEDPAGRPDQVTHTREEFFGDPAQHPAGHIFFPRTGGNLEDEIVRGAYIRAIDLVLAGDPDEPKPIVSYWIVTGRTDGADDGFEAFVSESDLEIHVLLLTPVPAYFPPKPDPDEHPERVIEEEMTVVSSVARIQQIEQGYLPGYPNTRFPLPGTNGVECLQVVGY